jgi:beta-1,4-mannosyltransferase
VLLSLLVNLPQHFDRFHVDVITEGTVDHTDLTRWLEEIGELGMPIRIVNVPVDYETPNGARFKTRANQFAMEARRAAGENTGRCYVYHLDDDTHIGKDTAASLAEFIELDGDRYFLAQGILTFPHDLTTSRFCRFADAIRPADDLTRFAFFTGLLENTSWAGYTVNT